MKTSLSILSCSLALFTANVLAKEPTNYADIKKQVSIMSNIIKSTAAVQSGRKSSKINHLDATYLKGQGVLFTISSGSSSRGWGNYRFNFSAPIPPIPPMAPPSYSSSSSYLSSSQGEQRFERELEVDMDETISEAYEEAGRVMESMQVYHEQYRELIDEQRDISYELRDINRELRDLSFQAKRADKNEKSTLTKRIKEHEADKLVLTQKQREFEKEIAKFRDIQQKEKLENEKEREVFYKELNYSLAETLCLYGNGLRKLPKNEHVSLIIKAGGDKSESRYKDQIFVFDKADIIGCSNEKITVKQLLTKGQGYQY